MPDEKRKMVKGNDLHLTHFSIFISRFSFFVSLFFLAGCPKPPEAARGAQPSPTRKPVAAPAEGTVAPGPLATRPERQARPGGQLLHQATRKGKQSYALYLPAGYKADRQSPLVVALAEELGPADTPPDPLPAWQLLADKNGWVLLTPQLRLPARQDRGGPGPDTSDYGRAWRDALPMATQACQAMVADVLERWSIDRRRMSVVGGRHWGELATLLAMDRPGRFAGLALLSSEMRTAVLDAKAARNNRQLAVLVTWAEDDTGRLGDGASVVAWLLAAGVESVDRKVYPGARRLRLEEAEKFLRDLKPPPGQPPGK